jgi:hypothetical protein
MHVLHTALTWLTSNSMILQNREIAAQAISQAMAPSRPESAMNTGMGGNSARLVGESRSAGSAQGRDASRGPGGAQTQSGLRNTIHAMVGASPIALSIQRVAGSCNCHNEGCQYVLRCASIAIADPDPARVAVRCVVLGN